ncbi:MAG TPA: polyhydroxyalkanoate synthesis repressor PhaR [Alphaproteobacteria bacterium]
MAEEQSSEPPASSEGGERASPKIKIKKYANRRLYNTATSSYVTLDHLCQMVKEGTEFVVYDAKTGEDITRSVLTQIIVEEEAKGQNLLPVSFLRQLISFYGNSLQALVPRYLDYSMAVFARNQEQIRNYMQEAFGGFFPFGREFEEMSKQNLALFQNAMKMFTPFAYDAAPKKDKPSEGGPEKKSEASSIDDLRAQLDAMQKRLEELSKK